MLLGMQKLSKFKEVRLFSLKKHSDERGYFVEQYQKKRYEELGEFVQDNLSFSKRGVIRGMHMQKGQAKLISALSGEIYDVIVDMRKGSDTFGLWEGYTLSEENGALLFVPDGFAHGFQVVSDSAYVTYKVSSFYDPVKEKGFRFDDPDLNISWPLNDKIFSQRDIEAPFLKDLK